MKITAILSALLVCATVASAQADPKKEKPKADPAVVFAKKDKNGDGKLSKEEFTAGAKDAAKAETQFTNKDKDKDGSVSKEEFTAAPKKKKEQQ
ncbi:MAG: EF-hand domain-containing protein [Roseimicrobium sp.]